MSGDDDAAQLSENVKKLIDAQSQVQLSQQGFSNLITKFVSNGQELLNYNDVKDSTKYKIAGLTVIDCVIDVNDEMVPQRRTEICNLLFKVLDNDRLPLQGKLRILQ